MCEHNLSFQVSPFLVGRIHTFTLNIQAVGGQRGGKKKKNMARGSRMIWFDALLFILRWMFFEACMFLLFPRSGLQQEVSGNILHFEGSLDRLSNDPDLDSEVYFTHNKVQ